MQKRFLVSYLFYLFAIAIVFPYMIWYNDNPDSFQYIAIAKKYLNGDFANAINGYWSPLISWLLIVPMKFLSDDIIAFKLLQVLAGAFLLRQWNKLLYFFPVSNPVKFLLAIAIIPFIVVYALLNLTPDLLFTGLLLMLLNQIVGGKIFSDKQQSIKTGITGGILYLTKAYGMPFFFAFTFIVLLIEKSGKHKWIDTKNIFRLYGIFFLICICWIANISYHYNRFTISEAARFNLNLETSHLHEKSAGLPVLSGGMYAPKGHDVSAWESPGEYLSSKGTSALNYSERYFEIIKRNVSTIYYFDFSHQIGLIFLVLLFLIIISKSRRNILFAKSILTAIIFILLFYFGYSLILVHARYTWINNLLMLLLSALFIELIFANYFRKIKFLALIFFFLFAIKRPVKEILFSNDQEMASSEIIQSILHPLRSVWTTYHPDLVLQNAVDEIKSNKNFYNANFASIKPAVADRDSYTNSLRIVNAVNGRYFGQTNIISATELKSRMNNINFLITWNNSTLENKSPVYKNVQSGLNIYDLQ
jgi:hypothetical protein